MLAVVSKQHNPEQIYEHFVKVGPLKVKMWKKFIILAFDDEKNVEKAYKKYRSFDLSNKRVELRMINDEGLIDEEYERERSRQRILPIQSDMMEDENTSKHIKIINNYRQKVMESVVNHTNKIAKEVRNKMIEIQQNFPDQEPRNRELVALEDKIKSKFNFVEQSFSNQLKTFANSIKNFSTSKAKIIQLEPNYEHKSFSVKNLDLNKLSIEEHIQFLNNQKNPIKRILALNETEFVLTQKNQKNGEVKFYSTSDALPTKTLQMQDCSYGIACANDYLFIGDRKGRIFVSVLNDQKTIDTTSHQIHKDNSMIFEIKSFRIPTEDFPGIITVGMDNRIIINTISQIQISDDLYGLQFKENYKQQVDGFIMALQLWVPYQYLYATEGKVIMYEVIQKSKQTFPMHGSVCRIKKFNENLFVVGTREGMVQLVDTRNQRIVQKQNISGRQIKALQISSQHSIFYGGQGVIGLIDDRKTGILWENRKAHQKKIYDIASLKNSIVSGDEAGKIICWNF